MFSRQKYIGSHIGIIKYTKKIQKKYKKDIERDKFCCSVLFKC